MSFHALLGAMAALLTFALLVGVAIAPRPAEQTCPALPRPSGLTVMQLASGDRDQSGHGAKWTGLPSLRRVNDDAQDR